MDILRLLKKEEGYSRNVYLCSTGHPTIGYGRKLDGTSGITKAEAEYLLKRDVERIESALIRKIDWYEDLSETRQGILICMSYQMGIHGLLCFKRMLNAMKHKEWEAARNEGLMSLWNAQTPERAEKLMFLMLD